MSDLNQITRRWNASSMTKAAYLFWNDPEQEVPERAPFVHSWRDYAAA